MSARETLVQAALTEFLAHGYDGTGVAKILTGTSLSKGAFYHHFSSKLALFETVISTLFPSPLSALDWSSHQSLNAKQQMVAVAALYAAINSSGSDTSGDLTRYYALFFDALSRLPGYRAAMNKDYGQLIGSLADALKRDNGLTLKQADVEARAFVAGFEGQIYLTAVLGTPAADAKGELL